MVKKEKNKTTNGREKGTSRAGLIATLYFNKKTVRNDPQGRQIDLKEKEKVLKKADIVTKKTSPSAPIGLRF